MICLEPGSGNSELLSPAYWKAVTGRPGMLICGPCSIQLKLICYTPWGGVTCNSHCNTGLQRDACQTVRTPLPGICPFVLTWRARMSASLYLQYKALQCIAIFRFTLQRVDRKWLHIWCALRTAKSGHNYHSHMWGNCTSKLLVFHIGSSPSNHLKKLYTLFSSEPFSPLCPFLKR